VVVSLAQVATPRSTVVVGGRSVSVTSPDKVLYPDAGVTKVMVIAYYVALADRLLPLLRRRPVTRVRWPGGVADPPFFEKQLPPSAPGWIDRVELMHSDGPMTYPYAHEAATLAWFAQQNALELHVPQWRSHGSGRRVDRVVLDLDPGPGAGLSQCVEVAFWLREWLAADGIESVPVTSGSKGLHVYGRWRPSEHPGSSSDYAKDLAVRTQRALPSLVTSNMAKTERPDRVLIDWSQNNPAKTTITPYSLRGRRIPYVAAPRTWAELSDDAISQLTMSEVLSRLDRSDPMSAVR
jgi:bifunctional non-homologous end joining protein LigD